MSSKKSSEKDNDNISVLEVGHVKSRARRTLTIYYIIIIYILLYVLKVGHVYYILLSVLKLGHLILYIYLFIIIYIVMCPDF